MKMKYSPPPMIPSSEISGLGPGLSELQPGQFYEVELNDKMAYVKELTNPDFVCPGYWFKPLDQFEEFMRRTFVDQTDFSYDEMRMLWDSIKPQIEEEDEA